MKKNIDYNTISVTELYEDQTLADGTVYYLDYFNHASYLLSGMKVIHESFIGLWKRCDNDISRHRSEMGLLFTLIFLTSQIVENLTKARSLYDLRINNKLKEYTTLKLVQQNYWDCKGHDVFGIIKASNITITEDEKKLIDTITPFIVWGGRYPHPFLRKDYVANAQNNRSVSFDPNNIGILDRMYERFADEMQVMHP